MDEPARKEQGQDTVAVQSGLLDASQGLACLYKSTACHRWRLTYTVRASNKQQAGSGSTRLSQYRAAGITASSSTRVVTQRLQLGTHPSSSFPKILTPLRASWLWNRTSHEIVLVAESIMNMLMDVSPDPATQKSRMLQQHKRRNNSCGGAALLARTPNFAGHLAVLGQCFAAIKTAGCVACCQHM
jgi:hypothetical protein